MILVGFEIWNFEEKKISFVEIAWKQINGRLFNVLLSVAVASLSQ